MFLLVSPATIFPTVPLHVTLCAPFIRHFAAETEVLAVVWHGRMKSRVSYVITNLTLQQTPYITTLPIAVLLAITFALPIVLAFNLKYVHFLTKEDS